MIRRGSGWYALAAAGALIAAAPVAATRATRESIRLTVTATGFRNTKGRAIVALYTSKEAWLHTEKALRVRTVPITGPDVTVTFDSLAPGTYAASAIHDENENGKLDMRYFPIPHPREGAGVSNNARKALGPPAWNDARFVLPDSATAITFTIRY